MGRRNKKKSKVVAASNQKTSPQQTETERENDSDKDISDVELANLMVSMGAASKPSTYVKRKNQDEAHVKNIFSQQDIPPSASEGGKSQNKESVKKSSGQGDQIRSKGSATAQRNTAACEDPLAGLSCMLASSSFMSRDSDALDDFKLVKAKAKPKRTVDQQQERVNIAWPLKGYEYRLVCHICFAKDWGGKRGCSCRLDHPHNCSHNKLIVRDKTNTSSNWLKIRPVPKHHHYREFRLCFSLMYGRPCHFSDASCIFAHNHAEINLWTMNRDGTFDITNFIQTAAKEGKYSSEPVKKSTSSQKASAERYIPGLQSPPRAIPPSTYVQPQPQLKQWKPSDGKKGIGHASVKTPASSALDKNINISEPNLSGTINHSFPRPETSLRESAAPVNSHISEFAIKNKQQPSKKNMTVDPVKGLISRFGGYFLYICRRCFFFLSTIRGKGEGSTCSGQERHIWSTNEALAHVCHGSYTVIDHPKLKRQAAWYRLCKYLHHCERWCNDNCNFAHSEVEMSVWVLERDFSLSRDEIIEQSLKLIQAKCAQTSFPTGTFPSAAKGTAAGIASLRPQGSMPPVKIAQFCRMCWGNGQYSTVDGTKDKCIKGHSHFSINSVFLAQPSGKEIRSLPEKLKPRMRLNTCIFGKKCFRPQCTYPHNEQELDTWKYMLRHSVETLTAVVERLQEFEKANARKIFRSSDSNAWQSQAKPLNEIIAPGGMISPEFYCTYCCISFNNQRQLEDHCASEKHKENVNWDKEHQWNYRQPPWGQEGSLSLCPSHLKNKSCRYSHVALDVYNYCKLAHSQEELDEWKERLDFRKMKRKMAHQKHMFSFTETLMEEFNNSNNSVDVLTKDLPDVKIVCEEKDVIYMEDKNASFSWTFHITSERNLERVGLLRNQDRLHFHLLDKNGSCHQVAPGNMFMDTDKTTGKNCFKIQVCFTAGVFGSLSQWVALDFGSRPVLVKKVCVEVGHLKTQMKELRENLTFVHWTSQSQKIIPCTNTSIHNFSKQLLQRYKEPQDSQLVVTSDSFAELNQHNYKHKMHKLLDLEEMTRQRIISRYNIKDNVEVINRIEEEGAFISATNGDVFLRAQLPEALTADTQAGELLLRSVKTVLMARTGDETNTVYEALVVDEWNCEYDVRGKERLYIMVHASTASALSLTPGSSAHLEIQFVMERSFFCHMHHALDSLNDDIIKGICFPDVNRSKADFGQEVKRNCSVLNEDQMAAVFHIVKDRKSYTPPFVMYGPFGTGKTETLARATMALLEENKSHRILICTQSNSAADLFITQHFNKFLESRGEKERLLRIYNKWRRQNTVDPVVLPYCYKADDTSFGIPTKEEVLAHQLILITLESSILLNFLGLQNQFTHIFIDEAAQALECETLMPLTLADTTTCVVMTGDPMQINPNVYSQEARKQKFDVSMLVRLFTFYDQMSSFVNQTLKSSFNIFLSMNYRSESEILKFISTVFYNGPDSLKAYGNVPEVDNIDPLMFYMVQGKEITYATSYLNQAEAEEAVAQVKELLKEWPQEWGERNAKSVAIITSYSAQTKCIRHMLRSDRSSLRKELNQVYVGPIQAVQGKEFRAVFISTVRTTNILKECRLKRALEEGGDIGDLGFLSNSKLINTAFSRAQSFVGVVGDAIALCMIGECIQEWQAYISHCDRVGSLYPQDYTYELIRNRVFDLSMGPHEEFLDLLSMQGEGKLKQSFPSLQ